MTNFKIKHDSFIRLLIAFSVMVMMFSPIVAKAAPTESGATTHKPNEVKNPGSDLWRDVRQRNGSNTGATQVKGVDSAVFINVEGQLWREQRVQQIIPYSGYLLAITLIVLIVFRLIRGQVKIESGRSENKILRFNLSQRTVHWIVASLFIILGLTGIIQLLGRTLLIPLMGNSAFSYIAASGKLVHDYLGPVFGIALIFMLFHFVKGNIINFKDLSWFANGGGMLGKHASAGRYNAGEKSWFWLAMWGGAAIIVSGVILSFPYFDQTRETMQFYLVVHGIAAVVVLAAAFGHIFMGTVAMEGALESMTTGYCDENWAKEHHDLWYEEVKDSAIKNTTINSDSATPKVTKT